MYRGKFYAVGGNPDNFPASRKTRWLLHLASEGECSYGGTAGLTQAEAHDLLQKYREIRALERIADPSDFAAVMTRAVNAANTAGAKWQRSLKRAKKEPSFYIHLEAQDAEIPVFGRLGDCYLRRDGHSAFTDFLRKTIPDIIDGRRVIVPHDHMAALEYDLLETCEDAALRVLRAAGIRGLELIQQPC